MTDSPLPLVTDIMADWYTSTRAKIDRRCSAPNGPLGCIMWTGGHWNRTYYGKIWVKSPSGRLCRYRVHRLMHMVAHRLDVLPRIVDGHQMDVSHLCHTPLCIKPELLVFESHAVNMDRLTCKLQHRCTRCHATPYCIL